MLPDSSGWKRIPIRNALPSSTAMGSMTAMARTATGSQSPGRRAFSIIKSVWLQARGEAEPPGHGVRLRQLCGDRVFRCPVGDERPEADRGAGGDRRERQVGRRVRLEADLAGEVEIVA